MKHVFDIDAAVGRVLEADTSDFVTLVAIAGLNPRTDFRHCNLSNVDFSGCDLSGFDFRGALLHDAKFSGAKIVNARFEQSAVLLPLLRKAADFDEYEFWQGADAQFRHYAKRRRYAVLGRAEWQNRAAPKPARKSPNLLREIARDLRRRLGIDGQHAPDLNQALLAFENLYPQFKLKAIPDARFPYMEAWVNSRKWTMYVRESVLEAIKYGNKRARFSIARQLGHLTLGHAGRYFRREPRARVPPAIRLAEREANAFASEFLMPLHLAQKYKTEEEIASAFKVSRSAAKQRMRELRRDFGLHRSNSRAVFVAIPFTPEKTRLYYEIIKPCVEELGLQSCRGDEISAAGPVFDNLEKAISACRLFVAEITNANPNVMNEIGIAQTRKKPIILISEAGGSNADVPHNIRHVTCISYQDDAVGGVELRRQLRQLLQLDLDDSG